VTRLGSWVDWGCALLWWLPFTLPAGMRPAADVFVPVGATSGRPDIAPSGVVPAQAETSFSDAQCITSLDGVLFVTTSASVPAPLNPEGQVTNALFGTSGATAEMDAGVVYLRAPWGRTPPRIHLYPYPAVSLTGLAGLTN
jgi:hypothetical protein